MLVWLTRKSITRQSNKSECCDASIDDKSRWTSITTSTTRRRYRRRDARSKTFVCFSNLEFKSQFNAVSQNWGDFANLEAVQDCKAQIEAESESVASNTRLLKTCSWTVSDLPAVPSGPFRLLRTKDPASERSAHFLLMVSGCKGSSDTIMSHSSIGEWSCIV